MNIGMKYITLIKNLTAFEIEKKFYNIELK